MDVYIIDLKGYISDFFRFDILRVSVYVRESEAKYLMKSKMTGSVTGYVFSIYKVSHVVFVTCWSFFNKIYMSFCSKESISNKPNNEKPSQRPGKGSSEHGPVRFLMFLVVKQVDSYAELVNDELGQRQNIPNKQPRRQVETFKLFLWTGSTKNFPLFLSSAICK